MQHPDTYLTGLQLSLGDELTRADARASGQLSNQPAGRTEQRAIRIAAPGTPLATRAARLAVDAAGIEAHQLGPVYYAVNPSATVQQFDPAARVMGQLGIDTTSHPAVTVANADQGVIDALTAAALYLHGCSPTGPAHALITAGGMWPPEWEHRRWTEPLPLSDGAGALVVTTRPDKCRLMATATTTHPQLASYRRRRRGVYSPLKFLLTGLVDAVLAEAGIKLSDIDYLITPFGSDRTEHEVVLPNANDSVAKQLDRLVDCGRDVGYLGAADLLAVLHHASHPASALPDGTHVLLLASGIASVGAAVLKVQWPVDAADER